MTQMDLFEWSERRPSNVLDAVPALARRIRIEAAYRIPSPAIEGKIIPLERPVPMERSVA